MKKEIVLNYEVKKSCSCGNESKSIKDFKPLSIGWCYESLGSIINYKCNKCGKEDFGWDKINLSLLVELGYVKDNRPEKFQYKFEKDIVDDINVNKKLNVVNSFGFDDVKENRNYHIIGKDNNDVFYYLTYIEKTTFTKNEFSIKNDDEKISVDCFSKNYNSIIERYNEYKEYLIDRGYEVEDDDYCFKNITIHNLECLESKFANYELIEKGC